MKIAVTAMGPNLEDEISTRFGRAPYFVIIDAENGAITDAIKNPNVAAGGGAGVQSAQILADQNVEAVLSGNCGPKAFEVFGAAGIKIVIAGSGTVQSVVGRYKAGELSEASGATGPAHHEL